MFAGLERIVNYLESLTFSETDIAYLKDLGYPEDFLDYLANLKLELTINSALEGDLVFANEPIFQVEGPYLLMNRFSKWKVPWPSVSL